MNTPGYRRLASLALWITLVVEAAWILIERFAHHAGLDRLGQPVVFFALFAVLAILRGRLSWYPLVIRIFFAYEFGSAVADRLGWLGPPGSGVAWGNFAHFVAYTHTVNAFLPVSFAFPLAVLATLCECTFAVTLLFGICTRLACLGTALLLFLFASAMTVSGLSAGQFYYAVYLLSAGAWYLSAIDPAWLSVDRLLARRRPAPAAAPAAGK
jgi:putative oxidoreductase